MISRLINAPHADVLHMLQRRMPLDGRTWLETHRVGAVAIVQVPVPEIFALADVALKAADVFATELHGNCPQHVSSLAIFGETSAVRAAVDAIAAERGADL